MKEKILTFAILLSQVKTNPNQETVKMSLLVGTPMDITCSMSGNAKQEVNINYQSVIKTLDE